MSNRESIYPLLCEASGETDLPAAFIAHNEDDLRHFINAEWSAGDSETDGLIADLERHDWRELGDYSFEFEIGGMSFKRVYETARAALAAQPVAQAPEGWREVVSGLITGIERADRLTREQQLAFANAGRNMLAAAPSPDGKAEQAATEVIGYISKRGLQALRRGDSPTVHAKKGTYDIAIGVVREANKAEQAEAPSDADPLTPEQEEWVMDLAEKHNLGRRVPQIGAMRGVAPDVFYTDASYRTHELFCFAAELLSTKEQS